MDAPRPTFTVLKSYKIPGRLTDPCWQISASRSIAFAQSLEGGVCEVRIFRLPQIRRPRRWHRMIRRPRHLKRKPGEGRFESLVTHPPKSTVLAGLPLLERFFAKAKRVSVTEKRQGIAVSIALQTHVLRTCPVHHQVYLDEDADPASAFALAIELIRKHGPYAQEFQNNAHALTDLLSDTLGAAPLGCAQCQWPKASASLRHVGLREPILEGR